MASPEGSTPADRALIHLPGRGFAARGVIRTEPRRRGPRWYNAKVGEIALLASAVPLAFVRDNHRAWKWPTYPRSYATIGGDIETRLEELLSTYQASFAEPLTEGAPKAVSATAYERNPVARQQCIAHYGTDCHVCGFSFGEVYGETTKGYIRVVDPIKDLRPICPNCHAVAHLQAPPLSIQSLKRMLRMPRA